MPQVGRFFMGILPMKGIYINMPTSRIPKKGKATIDLSSWGVSKKHMSFSVWPCLWCVFGGEIRVKTWWNWGRTLFLVGLWVVENDSIPTTTTTTNAGCGNVGPRMKPGSHLFNTKSVNWNKFDDVKMHKEDPKKWMDRVNSHISIFPCRWNIAIWPEQVWFSISEF